ncbi:MAG: hypothetical protein QW228_04740 [Candidatus Aenigmatarchaeota archaeon]
MILAKDLHIKLAKLLGDSVTPDGVEIVNGNEDGIRYTYQIRKSAIEFGLLQVLKSIKDEEVLNIFLEQNVSNPNDYFVIGDVHVYRKSIPNLISVKDVYLENSVTKKRKVLPNSGYSYLVSNLWLIGTGVYAIIVNNVYAMLPEKFHNTNLDELNFGVSYIKSEGYGTYSSVIPLDSGFEDLILNFSYNSIITKEVVKK